MRKIQVVEFLKHGKKDRHSFAITRVDMLYDMMVEKIEDGTVLYGNDSQVKSEELLKKDIADETVNFKLFKFSELAPFHQISVNNDIITFSDLVKIQEIVSQPNIDDLIDYMEEENVKYLVSEIEIRSNNNYFNGFIPFVDNLQDLIASDTYKSFIEQENTGTINISLDNNTIGNGEQEEVPTIKQAEILFNHMDELEKKFEIDTFRSFFFSIHEEEYSPKQIIEKIEEIEPIREDIFVLSNCDEWKTYASAKIKMATTDICMMHAAIFAEIKNDNMYYKSDNIEHSITIFLEDMERGDVEFGYLKYGMVEVMDNVLVENMATQSYVDNLEDYHNELFCSENSSEVDEHETTEDFER